MIGELILTNDVSQKVLDLKASLENARFFPNHFESGDFKMKDALDAIYEANISSNSTKYIILAGDKFNIASQNALLKSLEEPPDNIAFILIAKYKNGILPTVISRLKVINERQKLEIPPFELDLANINLESIYHFLKSQSHKTRDELRIQIASILFSAKNANIKFSKKELDCFDNAIKQVESLESEKYIFLPLLLMILNNKRNHGYD